MPYYVPGNSGLPSSPDKPVAINQPENAVQRFPSDECVIEYGDAVYVMDIEDDNYSPVIYRSDDGGVTWTIPDEANVPSPGRFTFKTVSDDTGTLHIFLFNNSTKRIDYETFNCGADEYDLDIAGSAGNNSPTCTAVNNVKIRDDGTFWVIYENANALYAVTFNGSAWGTPIDLSTGLGKDATWQKRIFGIYYDSISDSLKLWIKVQKFGQPFPVYYRIINSAGSLGSATEFEDHIKESPREYYGSSGYATRFNDNIVICYGRKHTDLSGAYAVYVRTTADVDSDAPTWTSELEIAYENTVGLLDDIDTTGYLAESGGTLYCWFSSRSFAVDHSPPQTYDGETISYVTSTDLTTWSDPVNVYDYPLDPVYDDDVLTGELVAVLGASGWHILTNYTRPTSHSLYFGPVSMAQVYHFAY